MNSGFGINVRQVGNNEWIAWTFGPSGPVLEVFHKKPKKAVKGLLKIMEEEGLFGPE